MRPIVLLPDFMHILIFTGGDFPAPARTEAYFEKNRFDYVIAADSGADTAHAYGIRPDFVLGDMDSISGSRVLRGITEDKIRRFARDKDFSDTELALLCAREMLGGEARSGRVTLVGGDGGRIDHLLAIYDSFSEPYHADVWLAVHSAVYMLRGGQRGFIRNLGSGQDISFMRTSSSRSGGKIITDGLMWEHDVFRPEGMPSLSNRIKPEYCKMHKDVSFYVQDGDFLLCVNHDNEVVLS